VFEVFGPDATSPSTRSAMESFFPTDDASRDLLRSPAVPADAAGNRAK
jgi:hypothetical protein